MNKEEILAKSRKENQTSDERELQVKNNSFYWIYITVIIAATIFGLVREARGEKIYDLPAITCYSVCAGFLYRFIYTKQRFFIIMTVISFAVAVLSTVRFFM